jgi:hypothetical protein
MSKMFIDGITNDSGHLEQLGEPPSLSYAISKLMNLGFREWAQYRDVWKDV